MTELVPQLKIISKLFEKLCISLCIENVQYLQISFHHFKISTIETNSVAFPYFCLLKNPK